MRLKNLLPENILQEKTLSISRDVDYVYKKAKFQELASRVYNVSVMDKIHDDLYQAIITRGKDYITDIIDSSELKSKDAQKAHAINPVKIVCGVLQQGSYYQPSGKVVHISYNKSVVEMLLTGDAPPEEQRKRFNNELQKGRIVSAISHELSHWIQDSFHKQITKLTSKAMELNSADVLKLHKKDVNMTYFEIDAQIHGLKALKKSVGNKEWDQMTLGDVYDNYTALHEIATRLKQYGKDVLNIWQKNLIKRMHREKLLGKNMRSFPKNV